MRRSLLRSGLGLGLAGAAAAALVGSGCGSRPDQMIQNKGSDTMVNLAQAWAEEYRKIRPEVAIAVSGGGSGTGIAAIINGTVDIANSSREIKDAEKAEAKTKNGKESVEHIVAYDALAVYVHAKNPIRQISREQLACIFGEGGTCENWGDIDLHVPGCSGQEIVRVSRQSNSGTFSFFREWVVGEKKDFKLGSRDMQGSKDVVDLIESTPCAIGYSGLGYNNKGVKVVCLAASQGARCVEPSFASALSGEYPISRALYMITVGPPQGEIARYLDWARSDEGQVIVERSGYAMLPKDKRTPIPATPAK